MKEHKGFLLLLVSIFLVHTVIALFPPLHGDEAYFWEWSRHLSLGYYSHPPMTGWLIFIITQIFSISQYTIRLTSILLHIITVLFVYLLSLDISKKKSFALFTSFIYSLTPIGVILGTAISTDSSLICFFTITAYCLRKAIFEDQKKYWYYLTIPCAGMLLSKFMAVLFFPGAFLFLCVHSKYRAILKTKEPYLSCFISFILFSPFLYWNYKNQWLTFQFNFTARHENKGFEILKFISSIAGQWVAVTPLFWLFLILFFIKIIKQFYSKQRFLLEPSLLYLSYLIGFPILFFFFLSFFIEIGAHWIGIIFPIASILVGAWFYSNQHLIELNQIIRKKSFQIYWIQVLIILIPLISIIISPKTFLPDTLIYTQKVYDENPPIGSHYYGWREVGERIEELYQEWKEKPEGFFFTTRDYAIASVLSFYTPSQPQFYLINVSKNEFHGKDFLLWEKNKKKLGANTIYIADTPDSYEGRMTPFFKSIKQLHPFIYRDSNGKILRIFYFTLGLGYKGGEENNL